MEMYIQVPDDAFVVIKTTGAVKETCRICDGTGNVKIKDKGFVCPDCNGSGGKMRYFPDWEVTKARFSAVTISAEARSVRYVYDVPKTAVYGKETMHKVELGVEDVFSNRSDAENKVSKRRNEGVSSEEERRCQYE